MSRLIADEASAYEKFLSFGYVIDVRVYVWIGYTAVLDMCT
jgi:hypothetical protein